MDNFLQFWMVRIFVLVLLSCFVPQWLCDISPEEPTLTNQNQHKENQEVKVERVNVLPDEHKATIQQDSGVGTDLGQHVEAHVEVHASSERNSQTPEKMAVETEATEPNKDILLGDIEPAQKMEDIGGEPKGDIGQQATEADDHQGKEDIGHTTKEKTEKRSEKSLAFAVDEVKVKPVFDRPCFPEDQAAEEEKIRSEGDESRKQEPQMQGQKVDEADEREKVDEKPVDGEEVLKEKLGRETLVKEEVGKEEVKTDVIEEEEHIPSFDE